MSGEQDPSRAALEEDLRRLKAKYGIDDVAYADGLEKLAEALLEAGDLEVALDRIGEAVGIYFSNKHAQIAQAIALEAEILATIDGRVAPFAELGDLPLEIVEEIAVGSLARARSAPAKIALTMLSALRRLLVERLGESHPATVRVLAGIANTEKELGDHRARAETLSALAASLDCIGAVPEEVEALLQRALSEIAIGDQDRAGATYREAIRLAEETRDEALLARCKGAMSSLDKPRS
jgi:tetratricopeptide (TPR) repeat protein